MSKSTLLLKVSFLLAVSAALYPEEQSLLEALKYASENIAPEDWRNRLEQANVDAADNNILDRLIGGSPVRKDLGLSALLSICEEVANKLPENGDFGQACLLAIGEQLHEQSQAQLLVDWIMASLPPKDSFVPGDSIYVANFPNDMASNATGADEAILAANPMTPPTNVGGEFVSTLLSNTEGTLAAPAPASGEKIEGAAVASEGGNVVADSGALPSAAVDVVADSATLASEEGDATMLATNQTEEGESKQDPINATLGAVSLANPFGTTHSPDACLNLAYLPYMDWVYYASSPSIFQAPMCCSEEEYSPCWIRGFFLAQPHYTFANVHFESAPCKQSAPGISFLGGGQISNHWLLSGKVDYGRSSNRWHPRSSQTSDSTNHWLFASSLTYQFSKAYIQGMLLGMYSTSQASNSFVSKSVRLSHWGLGVRLDGAVNIDVTAKNVRFGIQPYFSFDCFSAFQNDPNSLYVIYVKNAHFFQSKGYVKLYREFRPMSTLCIIPHGAIGFALANSFSRSSHPASCDTLPDFPNWRALLLGGDVSIFYKLGFIAKAAVDISLCRSVQIYSGNLSLGWNW